jgi:thioredoxin reductase
MEDVIILGSGQPGNSALYAARASLNPWSSRARTWASRSPRLDVENFPSFRRG